MKNQAIYTDRLAELAFHLEKNELFTDWTQEEEVIGSARDKEYRSFRPLLLELIDLFAEDFELNLQTGRVRGIGDRPLLPALQTFFGLGRKEVLHLFGIELQRCGKFGGRTLTRGCCAPIDIADNIFELLRINGAEKSFQR